MHELVQRAGYAVVVAVVGAVQVEQVAVRTERQRGIEVDVHATELLRGGGSRVQGGRQVETRSTRLLMPEQAMTIRRPTPSRAPYVLNRACFGVPRHLDPTPQAHRTRLLPDLLHFSLTAFIRFVSHSL